MKSNEGRIEKQSLWKPLSWVPSLYFIEGLPYVTVMTVAVIMYKRLELDNTDIALYTSWLYLPWLIKPIWSPIVDLFKTKRWWILTMQFVVGAALAGVALTIPADNFVRYTLVFFWLMAFSSATHDIAADGFYMLALSEKNQSFYVGIRNTFYRIAMIAGQGGLVYLAGHWEKNKSSVATAWQMTFSVLAILFGIFFLYHLLIVPRPKSDIGVQEEKVTIQDIFNRFIDTFWTFFKKDNIGYALAFLLLFRFGEAQLVKIASLFLLDGKKVGGLGLSTESVGIVYGTVGVAALTLGGLIGGIFASVKGLKYWMYAMAIAINLPNVVYVIMAFTQPESIWLIGSYVAIEQFGYGFGFTAYMLYMIFIAQGQSKTAHYALCTGFMALGMMLPGMWSGWLQEYIGYDNFFIWVLVCALPIFFIIPRLKLPPNFGKKSTAE